MSANPQAFREFHLPYDWAVLNRVHGQFVHHPRTQELVFQLDDAQVAIVGVMFLVVAIIALASPRYRPRIATTLIGVALAYGTTVVLKHLVDRGKPFLIGRLANGQHPGAVFPEGPGAVWVALAVGLWGISRPLSLLAAALALEDGFVQLARGSHWPSDLYAAWLLGLAGGLVGRALLQRVNRRGAVSPGS
jgi:membrane-associated phospholipid phosphatase